MNVNTGPTVATPPAHGRGEVIRPELLAPAGDWDCARAAVENGADAIYFGLGQHNARMRARNFSDGELPELMRWLHLRGVKGYACFNTLVFTDELPGAAESLRALIRGGVDAVLVQDWGICRLIRQLSPDLPIHASTQMTITSVAGVEFARELGCQLVVLARECSLEEINKLRAAQGPNPIPLEVFIHGALCVAYSGQCLTSEALGGRSANRGVCAQACRMPYELVCDGRTLEMGDRRYLLSPQDLAGLELLPELIKTGVASLKIEGRLKTPQYVANITRLYREAIDRVMAAIVAGNGGEEKLAGNLRGEAGYEFEMAFSRGLHTGWLRGNDNQRLVHGRFATKRGVFLGVIQGVDRSGVAVALEGPLKPGDGVVFDAGRPEETEQGGRVYEIGKRGPTSLLTFGNSDVDLRKIKPGDKIWKTSDPALQRRLEQSYAGEAPRFQRPIELEISGGAGVPLRVVGRDESGHKVEATSHLALVEAKDHPLTTERLHEQLGRLGGTPFRLSELHNGLKGEVILPVSQLNDLRRQLVNQLIALRSRPKSWQLNPTEVSLRASRTGEQGGGTSRLAVMVRSMRQLEAVLGTGVKIVYCDFEDPKLYREAVRLFRTVTHSTNTSRSDGDGESGPASIWLAPPRIYKMGEDWIVRQVRSAEPDGYLARNYDHLQAFSGLPCVGDYSLNIANPLSAELFMERFGLRRVTASYDLNYPQLEALLQGAPAEWFEVTIHQHMPMFHMEHCVFCAFLSKGKDYRDCGRPCDRHQLALRDRAGMQHPVKADSGCRNTVFQGAAQTAAEHVGQLRALGVGVMRLEFLSETPEQVRETISSYEKLLRGEMSGGELWRQLRLVNQLGVTRGQMGRIER